MALTRYGAALVGSASGPSIEGAYVQYVASTPYDSSRLHFMGWSASASNSPILIDIAVGAAAAETDIISDIATYTDLHSNIGQFVTFDVDIPAGSRIAGRARTSTASASLNTAIILEDRALASIANPVTYGVLVANTRGTPVDPGATVLTKGAYVEITASTTADIDTLLVCFTNGGSGVASNTSWFVDIATGAVSSEIIIIPDLSVNSNTAGAIAAPRPGIVRVPISIPTGTRLSARCQSSNNTASQRLIGVSLIGMQEPAAASLLASESVQFSVVRPD